MSDIRQYEAYLNKNKIPKHLDLRYFLVKGIYEQPTFKDVFQFTKLANTW